MTFKNITVMLLTVIISVSTSRADNLEKCFTDPPESSKPWVYWYWLSGHITKDGITKDLEAMAAAGIAEAFISNVHDDQIEPGDVRVLTEEWWDCMTHAVREAGRTGVKIGLFNCPGWSMSGGPWVDSDRTMRHLVSSETRVSGGRRVSVKLDSPDTDFRQLVVQAFPTPAGESDLPAGIEYIRVVPESSGDASTLFDGDPATCFRFHSYPVTVEIKYDRAVEVRSMKIDPAEMPMNANYELQYLDRNKYWTRLTAGKIDRQLIGHMAGPMKFGTISESFPAVRSSRFRIIFTDGGETLPWVFLDRNDALGSIASIELSGSAVLAHYIEKQMGKLAPTPYIHWDTYIWPAPTDPESQDMTVGRSDIIDITDKVDAAGVLNWDVPQGDWTIVRTGMAPTGSRNHPVMPECEGWEIDKMNKAHTQYHYDQYVGELLRRLGPEDRTALNHVVMDSYEQGPQNWTDGMAGIFRDRYGYDPLPWLPVLTGRIVESAELSDRFLWDLRRITADMIASEYIAGMKEKANADGMRLWCENYGFGFPGESLLYGGASDDVAGEFWNTHPELGPMECRIASSCANIYGKPMVSAEAFTSHQTHMQMPSDMKALGDWAFTQGINHFVFHLYIHQAYDRAPGVNAWFGTDFNRNSTWFLRAKPYYDYIRRTSAMLQQGKHVADILYYYGEDTPKQAIDFIPAPPMGADFDIANADVLMDARMEKGRITLRSGISYAVLVLPRVVTMRPEVLEKIASLVSDGAIVVGPRPERSPSLEGYPLADERVNRMASELWGGIDGVSVRSVSYGRGRMYSNVTLEQVFAENRLRPDMVLPENMIYTHRRDGHTDLYFVSNQGGDIFEGEIGFSAIGRKAELWDAVTGEIRLLSEWEERDGYTFIPLKVEPARSWFVVFRDGERPENVGRNFPEATEIARLYGPWTVSFDPSAGAPSVATFDDLTDWTIHPAENIMYYSGTAVYSKEFNLDHVPVGGRIFLDMGGVGKMAEVKVNGHDAGTAWCPPYSVEITGMVAEGRNRLEIEVTNPWFNRIVGDRVEGTQNTWMTMGMEWAKDAPLIPSGLTGPVRIELIPDSN